MFCAPEEVLVKVLKEYAKLLRIGGGIVVGSCFIKK
jgi:hypothetical protein